MSMRALVTAGHMLHILLLMLLRPAVLFARINALPWYRDMLQQWAASVIGDEPATVLEVGCATGELTHFLANKGHHVTGVDTSQSMLARAKTASNSDAEFKPGNVTQLPFDNGHFQHVLAASLINVVDDPVAALREMARVCQNGGTVSVLVPQERKPTKQISALADELNLQGFSRAALFFWMRMARKLSVKKLEEYLGDAGLSDLRCQPYLDGIVIAVAGLHSLH